MAEGLKFYGIPADGGIVRDFANPSRPVKSFSGAPLTGSRGTGGCKTTYANAATTDLAFSSGASTLLMAVQIPGTLTTAFTYGFIRAVYTDETHNTGWALQVQDTNRFRSLSFGNNGVALYQLLETPVGVIAVNNYYVSGITTDGTTRTQYRDYSAQGTTTNNPVPNASTGDLIISDPAANLSIMAVAAWARVLKVSEIAEFYQNPYCMLAPKDVPVIEYGQLSAQSASFYSWQTR